MFGENKAIEAAAAAAPAAKLENSLKLKNAPGETAATPVAANNVEIRYAANFARLKKSLRKGSRGIF